MSASFVSTEPIFLASLLLAGLVLLVRGLRGRRVGDEPRCRECGYNLTGITSSRCPECGGTINEAEVVFGVRRRRRFSLALGAVLSGIAVLGLGLWGSGLISRVNWYACLPSSMLVHWAEGDDRQAIVELKRRVRSQKVSGSDVSELVPIALARHGASPRPSDLHLWAEILALLDSDDYLTDEERGHFYKELLIVDFQVRARVRQGEPLPVRAQYEVRTGACDLWSFTLGKSWLQLGQEEAVACPWDVSNWLVVDRPGLRSYGYKRETLSLEPQRYPMELTAKIILSKPEGDWTKIVKLRREVEILPANAEDPITITYDPSVAPVLKEAISFPSLYIAPPESGWARIDLMVEIRGPLPVNVAFDVMVLADGRETYATSLAMARESEGSGTFAPWVLVSSATAAKGEIAIILRSSRKVAAHTVDLYDIWGGELRFEDVPLTR